MPIDKTQPTWELEDLSLDNAEVELFEDKIVEFTDIAGISIDYRMKDITVPSDRLYGETPNLEYLPSKRTKLIYEVTEEAGLIRSLGFSSDETISFAEIPVYTFSRDVSATASDGWPEAGNTTPPTNYLSSPVPRPGDVLRVIWNNLSYEVVSVVNRNRIFQLTKKIYGLILKPYRYAEQSDSAKEMLADMDITLTSPITGFGDNEWIEEESDDIYDYGSDLDTSIYGY